MSSRTFSLHQAIKSGDTNAVTALLAGGANVNETNDAGQTPLIIAIVSGQYKCLRPLLRAGANPWLRDNTGLTAIDWAERKGETELAHSLSTQSKSPSQSSNSSPEASKPPAIEQKTAQPNAAGAPRTPLSPDEKTRRFIAGLKLRLDERATRDLAGNMIPSEQQPPQDLEIEAQPVIPEIVKTIEPPIEAPVVTAEILPSPEPPRPAETKTTANQQTSARAHTPRTSQRTAADVPPEIVTPEIVTKVDVVTDTKAPPALLSPSPSQRPSRSSSKRKRCPQCGTFYTSDLLAYCSYDAVALVDEDAPIVPPRPPKPSPVLWILVIIVAAMGALAGLLVTERLLRRPAAETQVASAPQPLAPQKGIPELGRQLAGKELSLIEAEVPGNTVKGPASVKVFVRIDRAGQVYWATSEEGEEVLRDAAIAAAKKSTFAVEKLRGRTEGTITYKFK